MFSPDYIAHLRSSKAFTLSLSLLILDSTTSDVKIPVKEVSNSQCAINNDGFWPIVSSYYCLASGHLECDSKHQQPSDWRG